MPSFSDVKDVKCLRSRNPENDGCCIRYCLAVIPPDLKDHEGARRKLALLILRHMDQGECDARRLSDRALLDFIEIVRAWLRRRRL